LGFAYIQMPQRDWKRTAAAQLTSAARGAIAAATRQGKPHIRATTISDITID